MRQNISKIALYKGEKRTIDLELFTDTVFVPDSVDIDIFNEDDVNLLDMETLQVSGFNEDVDIMGNNITYLLDTTIFPTITGTYKIQFNIHKEEETYYHYVHIFLEDK